MIYRFLWGEDQIIQLKFPRQVVIYLESVNVPNEYKVKMDFGKQGVIDYRIPVIRFQEESIDEIKEKSMVILLPFKLIKLRRKIEAVRSKENISELRELYEDDIISTIESSYASGGITARDMDVLMGLTKMLFDHLYKDYEELKGVDKMFDHSLELEIDKYLDAIDEKDMQLEEKDMQLEEKDAEIAKLKAELAELRK